MGCFLGCFGGGRKNRRRQKFRESDQAKSTKLSAESAKPDSVPTVEEIPIPITEICEKVEEKCSPSPNRKKVTFDSNVKTHEHIKLQDSVEILPKKKEEVKSEERSLNSNKTDPEIINVTSNSTGLYPSNHRYNNCRESDDEIEEDELHCNESDDEEYYSDDGFSEDKLRNVTKEDYIEEIGDNGLEIEEIDAKKPRGVLNPVENLTQWKSAKSKERTMQKQSQKENSSLISDQEDKSDSSSSFKKPRNEEVTVEASLSTWLSTSESNSECNSVSMETPTLEKHKSSHYSKPVHKSSHDDRPILGALTLEEIKQFSATSTPRKSPSKSAVETPIIGTVGGYWGNSSDYSKAKDCGSASSFKGIPNTTSKYREDKSVSWHSTPFEARLEKALNSKEKSFDLVLINRKAFS